MPLQIKLVTSSVDYPALAAIKHAAFSSNSLHQLMYPSSVSPSVLQAWLVEREKRDARSPFQRIVAVVDTEKDDEIIAYAKWELPSSLVRGGSGEEMESVDLGPVPTRPKGINEEVWGEFRGGIDGMREKWAKGKELVELHSLVTHPAHQGRGAAGLLLRWGIEQADAAGKTCYLESTPAGFPVYCKYGWVSIDEIVIDLEAFGGGKEVIVIMIREPERGLRSRQIDDVR